MQSSSFLTEAIGNIAAILTTVAFAPQAVRTWRVGGDGLSWAMLALFGTGVGLWFVYGVLRDSEPLMLANGLTGIQVLFILVLKCGALKRGALKMRRGARSSDRTPQLAERS